MLLTTLLGCVDLQGTTQRLLADQVRRVFRRPRADRSGWHPVDRRVARWWGLARRGRLRLQHRHHVVVMHRGRLVASGSVDEVVAGTAGHQLAVDDPTKASKVLAAAGISAQVVPARRALEDVFLDLIGSDES